MVPFSRQVLCVHHPLQCIDADTYRSGNTRVGGPGDPSSDTCEDQSSGNREPHLHREPTEQRAAAGAIAGLGCLPQRRGGGDNSGRTDSLRGALELVRDRSQVRKIAGARGPVDLPFRINCCFTESPHAVSA